MPKLSKSALDGRRSHILRAAEQCFAKSGFRSTTIADIKREAGVSTGAIYTYFPNKEAMMRALLEAARDDRKKQLERATQGGAGEGGQALLLLEWAAAVFGPQGLHAARIDVNLWSEALRNPRVGKLARAALQEATDSVSRVVAAQLRAKGTPDAFDADTAASLLIAVFLGIEVQTAVGMKLDASEAAKVLAAIFADFLPSGERAASAAKPGAASKRATRGKRSVRASR
ncbi:MAG TPA: TetR/AcrR family transcriptional regulator [Polyangiales bacterium]|jgi:AcrR family transcriptional regulator|nr:TetR/AcrR family transcriptional regulator [Polyangiales bacterium]